MQITFKDVKGWGWVSVGAVALLAAFGGLVSGQSCATTVLQTATHYTCETVAQDGSTITLTKCIEGSPAIQTGEQSAEPKVTVSVPISLDGGNGQADKKAE